MSGGGDHSRRSESEEQSPEERSSPAHRCRNIPSSTGFLCVISSSTGDNCTNVPTSQQNFLSSSTAGDVDHFLTLPEILLDLDLAAEGRYGRRNLLQDFGGDDRRNGVELCEGLGFESSIERIISGDDLSLESIWKTVGSNPRSSRMVSDGIDPNIPPLLSTMDGLGRPRYELEKVRSEGRLVIAMKRSERRRRVVRAWGSGNGEQMITRMVVLDD